MGDRNDFSNRTHASESPEDFYTLQKQVFELYYLGKYREALTLAEKAAARFPGKDERTTYWKVCLRSRLGELGEALQLFTEATRRGLWWSEEALKTETDLDPVRDRPEFKNFLAECERMNTLQTAQPSPS